MKDKTSLVFTGDIGFDRYMYKKWEDPQLISPEILSFLHSADHVIANVEGPVAEAEQTSEPASEQIPASEPKPKRKSVVQKISEDEAQEQSPAPQPKKRVVRRKKKDEEEKELFPFYEQSLF